VGQSSPLEVESPRFFNVKRHFGPDHLISYTERAADDVVNNIVPISLRGR